MQEIKNKTKMKIPERYTSSCIYKNKELHIDTGNGDYLWVVDGKIIEQGSEPSQSNNKEIIEFAKEIE